MGVAEGHGLLSLLSGVVEAHSAVLQDMDSKDDTMHYSLCPHKHPLPG